MVTSALLILVPLFLGFAVPLRRRHRLTVVHHTVNVLVYLVLGLLGVGLGQLEGLAQQLTAMAVQVSTLVIGLLLVNLAALWLWHRWQPLQVEADLVSGPASYRRLFLAALK